MIYRDPNPILEQFHKIKKNKFLGHFNSNNVQFESAGSSISKLKNHVPMTLLKERFSLVNFQRVYKLSKKIATVKLFDNDIAVTKP